jgi:xylulokinase
LGLDSTNLNQANVCRAAVEGTTFGLRYGLDLLRDNGIKSANIRLIGGGAKSAIWRQIVADIMDTPVICTTGAEAAALGAAIQAAWCHSGAAGEQQTLQAICDRCVRLDPNSETRPVSAHVAAYEKVYQHYRNQLQGI